MLDLPKLTLLYKTFQADKLTILDKIMLNRINIELLVANIQKQRQVQHIRIQCNSQSACFLSLEDIEKRR